ncbi:helix-turn-helix transcriptional regulator [Algoriphagus sp.]|uniref:helix-turn-helix transcriptional regulator n=1 Tax=Algoriphagus sp. TaxID=1872435 RepID=UPI00271CF02B|nr:helix-turn-helix transcriptional regulator [Algoriphagus sp.]MDO8968489.1 helix-turn-helix transcriptional regulator [Algoriphagus sp.]MDP3200734.1 helix-turn-helix transcriptional regulator [Algoriphagus sp.]
MNTNIHHGRNIKRFREMLGIKQEAMADALGSDWSQKKVSLLEQKEQVELELMKEVAAVLKVPVEAIEKFDQEFAVNIISNTFTTHDQATGFIYNQNPTFNPLDKLLEVMEENKKLYERLFESEREKVELLKKLLDK